MNVNSESSHEETNGCVRLFKIIILKNYYYLIIHNNFLIFLPYVLLIKISNIVSHKLLIAYLILALPIPLCNCNM